MAYNTEDLVKLNALKALAERVNTGFATKDELSAVSEKVEGLVTTGGEPNVIESVSVNGTALEITEKSVNVTVPTAVSELTNDSGFQTESDVTAAVQEAISESGHASFEVADAVPDAGDAKSNVLYLVMNATTGYYDIYALVSGEMILIDDTTVDLTNYVEKEDGKGLSTNDYTDDEKTKLAGIEEGANNYTHPTYTAQVSGLYKITVDETGHISAVVAVEKSDITALGIPESDTTYSVATTTEDGLMSASDKEKLDGIEIATDEEVEEMLTEVFGEAASE